MTDHKFEPFQKVLVRDGNSKLWRADFFSYNDGDGEFPFCCVREDWRFCIPYTPETAHLLGTSQPYEPPKPPVEYKWGDKVEVLVDGIWSEGVCLAQATSGEYLCSIKKMPFSIPSFKHNEIRPITCSSSCSL